MPHPFISTPMRWPRSRARSVTLRHGRAEYRGASFATAPANRSVQRYERRMRGPFQLEHLRDRLRYFLGDRDRVMGDQILAYLSPSYENH